ncbi:predicted protein [Arabidopsis lyrata subsp. lyrata]|uniref:Patatin n=1 Tax=Arabidopsis lyrata subsp. lyrata TaxID=81972 RepID=D7LGT1_ARALL|nr:predicted protein [Arabidopsis lyrata subsp. lyrata]
MEGNSMRQRNLPPADGKLVTILSIDGGGVRGIMAGVILAKLEEQLQAIDGDQARIVQYFDMVAGTSTGGLITAMLTAPEEPNSMRPLMAAKDIAKFYTDECPMIFPTESRNSFLPSFTRFLRYPKFDGEYLRSKLDKLLKETRLNDTLTRVVIPTFDIKKLEPVIFSSYQAKADPSLNAKLSDICIGTSAAPTILPPHQFSNVDSQGTETEFNLIDGGVAANNPTLVGMNAMSRKALMKHPDMEGDRIGKKEEEVYNAKDAGTWGIFSWMYDLNDKSNPLLDIIFESSRDVVQYHTSVLFQAKNAEENYFRIDVDTLETKDVILDLATKNNLENLKKIGDDLLTKNVMRMNLNTYEYESISETVTNKQELKRFAKILSDERKLRKKTWQTMSEGSSN